jgi:hypothetical protein
MLPHRCALWLWAASYTETLVLQPIYVNPLQTATGIRGPAKSRFWTWWGGKLPFASNPLEELWQRQQRNTRSW